MFPEQCFPVSELPHMGPQVHATLRGGEQLFETSCLRPNSPALGQALLDLGEPFPCIDPGDLLFDDWSNVLGSYGQGQMIEGPTTALSETTMPLQEHCSLKRRRLGSEERESRKLVRREKACLRCRMYRIKVSDQLMRDAQTNN